MAEVNSLGSSELTVTPTPTDVMLAAEAESQA
jgi:hypothetical protein